MSNEMLIQILKLYEQKLQEYMNENEYKAFTGQVAKIIFFAEVAQSPNDDFKKMVFENWDAITAPTGENDPYDQCCQTGEYEDQDCMFCRHRFECSGSEVDDE